ncbi:hypothetical protein LHJ74_21275 [Streptomyces sp. N2-109]|uniref:Mce-associated membrane protein n=1 Tax=Streptomyces gossypii TaxID=2883101 RepID=A0ABT2JYI8_9ACTN|nr:hypothetical protein [Streptomyces gossypii]MCT2592405.1 hypothetical protein [Streptomyces gossypii]
MRTRIASAPGLVLVLVVSTLFCAFSLWAYVRADGDGDLSYARARDDALGAARTHVARLSSMDGTHVAEGLRKWRESATGPLRDELERTRGKSAEVLKEEGTTTRGTVTDAAVTQLDERAGTAKVIAMVRVAVEPRRGEATTDRKRFEAGLARTADGWRLTSLQAVPAKAN